MCVHLRSNIYKMYQTSMKSYKTCKCIFCLHKPNNYNYIHIKVSNSNLIVHCLVIIFLCNHIFTQGNSLLRLLYWKLVYISNESRKAKITSNTSWYCSCVENMSRSQAIKCNVNCIFGIRNEVCLKATTMWAKLNICSSSPCTRVII